MVARRRGPGAFTQILWLLLGCAATSGIPLPTLVPQEVVDAHNKVRRTLSLDDISWATDDTAAASAVGTSCPALQSNLENGILLFRTESGLLNISEALESWIPSDATQGRAPASYATRQVLWQGTKTVGCTAHSCEGDAAILVCKYSPPYGNIQTSDSGPVTVTEPGGVRPQSDAAVMGGDGSGVSMASAQSQSDGQGFDVPQYAATVVQPDVDTSTSSYNPLFSQGGYHPLATADAQRYNQPLTYTTATSVTSPTLSNPVTASIAIPLSTFGPDALPATASGTSAPSPPSTPAVEASNSLTPAIAIVIGPIPTTASSGLSPPPGPLRTDTPASLPPAAPPPQLPPASPPPPSPPPPPPPQSPPLSPPPQVPPQPPPLPPPPQMPRMQPSSPVQPPPWLRVPSAPPAPLLRLPPLPAPLAQATAQTSGGDLISLEPAITKTDPALPPTPGIEVPTSSTLQAAQGGGLELHLPPLPAPMAQAAAQTPAGTTISIEPANIKNLPAEPPSPAIAGPNNNTPQAAQGGLALHLPPLPAQAAAETPARTPISREPAIVKTVPIAPPTLAIAQPTNSSLQAAFPVSVAHVPSGAPGPTQRAALGLPVVADPPAPLKNTTVATSLGLGPAQAPQGLALVAASAAPHVEKSASVLELPGSALTPAPLGALAAEAPGGTGPAFRGPGPAPAPNGHIVIGSLQGPNGAPLGSLGLGPAPALHDPFGVAAPPMFVAEGEAKDGSLGLPHYTATVVPQDLPMERATPSPPPDALERMVDMLQMEPLPGNLTSLRLNEPTSKGPPGPRTANPPPWPTPELPVSGTNPRGVPAPANPSPPLLSRNPGPLPAVSLSTANPSTSLPPNPLLPPEESAGNIIIAEVNPSPPPSPRLPRSLQSPPQGSPTPATTPPQPAMQGSLNGTTSHSPPVSEPRDPPQSHRRSLLAAWDGDSVPAPPAPEKVGGASTWALPVWGRAHTTPALQGSKRVVQPMMSPPVPDKDAVLAPPAPEKVGGASIWAQPVWGRVHANPALPGSSRHVPPTMTPPVPEQAGGASIWAEPLHGTAPRTLPREERLRTKSAFGPPVPGEAGGESIWVEGPPPHSTQEFHRGISLPKSRSTADLPGARMWGNPLRDAVNSSLGTQRRSTMEEIVPSPPPMRPEYGVAGVLNHVSLAPPGPEKIGGESIWAKQVGRSTAQLLSFAEERAPGAVLWEENFDTLDTASWGFDVGNACDLGYCGWGNNELEWYTAGDNVAIVDGVLGITAKYNPDGGDKKYTSTRMSTRGKHAFSPASGGTSGIRVEASIALPKGGNGLWPAFWMLPDYDAYGTWPESGEIDIMEAVNTFSTLYGTAHWGSPHGYSAGTTSLSPGSHRFAVEWTTDHITWFVDGNQYHQVSCQDVFTSNSRGSPKGTCAPFDRPFYIVLNLAVGGDLPRNLGAGDVNPSDFPQTMYVDWIRVTAL